MLGRSFTSVHRVVFAILLTLVTASATGCLKGGFVEPFSPLEVTVFVRTIAVPVLANLTPDPSTLEDLRLYVDGARIALATARGADTMLVMDRLAESLPPEYADFVTSTYLIVSKRINLHLFAKAGDYDAVSMYLSAILDGFGDALKRIHKDVYFPSPVFNGIRHSVRLTEG